MASARLAALPLNEWSEDERELLEVLFVIGSYVCLAMVLNGVGVQPVAGSDRQED